MSPKAFLSSQETHLLSLLPASSLRPPISPSHFLPRTNNGIPCMNTMDTGEPNPPAMSHVFSWISTKANHASSVCANQLCSPAAPLMVACFFMALTYNNWRKARVSANATRPVVLHRSLSMAALHGGRLAVQRILQAQEAHVDKDKLDDAARHLHDLLAREPLRFKKLQKAAAKLEMSGKEEVAVRMLQKAWEEAEKERKPHEAHELEMLLVEMLIYKGEYRQALECKCLQDNDISDARRPLYKAVIYTVLDNKKRAKDCYEEFQKIRSRFEGQDSFKEGTPLHAVVHDFTKFEKYVHNLKREIEHAQGMKPGE